MRHYVLWRANNSKGKKDASGAFTPEGVALMRMLRDRGRETVGLGVSTEGFPNRAGMVKFIMSKFETDWPRGGPDSVSILCHGWRTGIEFLPRGLEGAKQVAEMLAARKTRYLNLFTCSAAGAVKVIDGTVGAETPMALDPRGSWAQWVTAHCASLGHSIQVLGHETKGHTTWNARVRLFVADGQNKTFTTNRVVDLDDPEFAAFKRRMRDDQQYRLLLPFWLNE